MTMENMTQAVPPFEEFPKIARLQRQIIITEKIDGTNAQVLVLDDGRVIAGSRNRYITPDSDNFGFAAWVAAHADELRGLGVGRHFGEWWGSGVQRGYGLTNGERRFSLFNTSRWYDRANDIDRGVVGKEEPPACCSVVPVLYSGMFTTAAVDRAMAELAHIGSFAEMGFMNPEGVVVYHVAAGEFFKRTIHKDAEHKGTPRAVGATNAD